MDQIRFTNTQELVPIIELRGVTQVYGSGESATTVIKDLDLLIEDKPEQGQFIVILGKSGCGKSTILRYIAGLQKPTSGEVLVRGEPRSEEDVISMVFQRYSSFYWMSVLDNVMFPLLIQGVSRKEAKERAFEMLKTVGLEKHSKKYAQYPTLSGGQLQRVAIARSMISNPEIIMMDEPFGALDLPTKFQMQMMLLRVWEKIHSTIVFVTHSIRQAVLLADEILIMSPNPGRITHRVHVDLPFYRNEDTLDDPRFLELVSEVDKKLRSTATEE